MEISNELEEIVKLTPDTQNLNNLDDESYYEFYDKVAATRGVTNNPRAARYLEVADMIDCTGFLFDYFVQNKKARKFGDIRSTVNKLYSDFDKQTKEDIIKNIKLRVSDQHLTSEDKIPKELMQFKERVHKRYDDFRGIFDGHLYHGTGSGALDGINKHGALLSQRSILDLNEQLNTGEQDIGRQLWSSSLVHTSLYKSNGVHHALRDGIGDFEDFPVLFYFDRERIDELGPRDEVYSCHMDQEGGEICVKHKIPLTCGTDVFVPYEKMNEVEDFAVQHDLKLHPIEVFDFVSKYSFPDSERERAFKYVRN